MRRKINICLGAGDSLITEAKVRDSMIAYRPKSVHCTSGSMLLDRTNAQGDLNGVP